MADAKAAWCSILQAAEKKKENRKLSLSFGPASEHALVPHGQPSAHSHSTTFRLVPLTTAPPRHVLVRSRSQAALLDRGTRLLVPQKMAVAAGKGGEG